MKKILVGVDGSEQALKAVKLAADVARGLGAKLVLVHASWPNLLSPAVYPDLIQRLEQEEREQARKMMTEMVAKAQVTQLAPEQLIQIGSPAETLADAALDEEVGMVVVGSHGRNAAARVLLGSVSDRLVHICKKPVLVVR